MRGGNRQVRRNEEGQRTDEAEVVMGRRAANRQTAAHGNRKATGETLDRDFM